MDKVPALPWPHNLFRDFTMEVATTAPLFTGTGKKVLGDNLCGCGCKRPHNYAVSRLIETQRLGIVSRSVAWYRTMDCRNKHAGTS